MARILIATSCLVIINRSYNVTNLDTIYTVRLMEDSYLDPIWGDEEEKVINNVKEVIFYDNDSVAESLHKVPETIFHGGEKVAERQLPARKSSNSKIASRGT